MFFLRWFRRQPLQSGINIPAGGLSGEAGIAARVDMVRFEALAEAACNSLFEADHASVRNRIGEVRRYFDAAIHAAKRANLPQEAARLTRRRVQVMRAYDSQIRHSSGR